MNTVTYITDTKAHRYLIVDYHYEIAAECELQGLTQGHADIWATLNVLKAIGGNVEKFLD